MLRRTSFTVLFALALIGSAHVSAFRASYSTGKLAGRNLTSLFSDYTGIHGYAPSQVQVDYCHNLRLLWDRKIDRSGRNPVVKKTGAEVVAKYCGTTPGRLSLKQYRSEVGQVVSDSLTRIDWPMVGRIEGLSPRKLTLVRNIAGSLTGDDFLAYAATELMPSDDGNLNLLVFDFLTKSAGRGYVESIPAVFDPYTSFGPYQFTQFAWFHVGKERRGGSIVNPALRPPLKHESVAQLRGNEHHVAALLLAIHNLAHVVSGLSERQTTVLESVWSKRHGDVVQYIAVAHHMPNGVNGARGAFVRWLDGSARQDFSVSLARGLVLYARKTRANMAAMGGI